MVKKMVKSVTKSKTVEYMPVQNEPRPIHVNQSTRKVETNERPGILGSLRPRRKRNEHKNAEDFLKATERQ